MEDTMGLGKFFTNAVTACERMNKKCRFKPQSLAITQMKKQKESPNTCKYENFSKMSSAHLNKSASAHDLRLLWASLINSSHLEDFHFEAAVG